MLLYSSSAANAAKGKRAEGEETHAGAALHRAAPGCLFRDQGPRTVYRQSGAEAVSDGQVSEVASTTNRLVKAIEQSV